MKHKDAFMCDGIDDEKKKNTASGRGQASHHRARGASTPCRSTRRVFIGLSAERGADIVIGRVLNLEEDE